jgi:threonine/homoserine/homoserine lactone efflux protein
MLDLNTLPLFLTATIVLLLTPGPAVLYIITRSVDQGRRAGLVSVLGIEAGGLFHVAAAALGISAILMTSALAFEVVKYLGAAYLIYLGVQKLRSRVDVEQTEVVQPDSLRRIFSQGVIVNVLNPKTALFFFAFLPQFVDPSRGSVAVQMVMLGILFLLTATITDGMYAVLAGTAGRWLRGNLRFLRAQKYVAGIVYIGLGVVAALTPSNAKQ